MEALGLGRREAHRDCCPSEGSKVRKAGSIRIRSRYWDGLPEQATHASGGARAAVDSGIYRVVCLGSAHGRASRRGRANVQASRALAASPPRLSEQAGFRCAGCLTDKVANFVATKGGDWAQTLCDECYASLVNGSRPTVYTAPRPVRPKIPQLQQSQKLKSKKPASKSCASGSATW